MTGITSVINKYSDCAEDIERFISYVPNLMEKVINEVAKPISDEEAYKMLGIEKEQFEEWLQRHSHRKKVAS